MSKRSSWLALLDHPIKSNRQRLYHYFDRKGQQLCPRVYLLELDHKALTSLLADIPKIIATAGSVSLIPVCSACRRRALQLTGTEQSPNSLQVLIITGE